MTLQEVQTAIAERTVKDPAFRDEFLRDPKGTLERYSGGGMIAHAPPGVLTEFGPALREPCGRIHWAGTESSALMFGFIDGAVRSGERAAVEVMEHDKAMTTA